MDFERVWAAHSLQPPAARHNLALVRLLRVWDRLCRRRLRAAWVRWHRQVRLLSAQTQWEYLVEHQRQYLLRKLVLRVRWRRVATAFDRWVAVLCAYTRLGQRMIEWRHVQLVRLAWATWWRRVRMERLDEEAAACRCVLWTRKLDRTVRKAVGRSDRQRLVTSWVVWKQWYRRRRCHAWRRGMPLAMRKYFCAWQRHVTAIAAYRARVQAMALAIFFDAVDDCVAQCRWRQNLRLRRRADAIEHLQRVLQRWSERMERQWLAHAMATWQSVPVDDAPASEIPIVPIVRMPTFPERFTAAYRKNKRTQDKARATHTHRPSWR